MSLPRRNPIVLVAYSLAIVSMFSFMAWVSLPLAEYAQATESSVKEAADSRASTTRPNTSKVLLSAAISISSVEVGKEPGQ